MATDTDSLTAALEEIRETIRAPFTYDDYHKVTASSRKLLAALDEVLALHSPQEHLSYLGCTGCTDGYGDPADWPCPTVQAVTSGLLGEEARNGS